MSEARGHIPEHKIDEVRQAADIVKVVERRVALVRKGRDFWGRCPFHGDQDPSFKVDRDRGTWHCFGCGEGGSVFQFLMKDQGLSFPEAVRALADEFGVALPEERLSPQEERAARERERLYATLAQAQEYFLGRLAGPEGAAARAYLTEKRGLKPEAVRDFGLGFAPESWEGLGRHLAARGVARETAVMAGLLVPKDQGSGAYDRFRGRVIFPIRDLKGRVISFGGRVLGPGEPKYLNGPETPLFNKSQNLYNLDRARAAMHQTGRAILVEGYLDAITCAAHGFAETVAPLGTALTAEQVKLLKRLAPEVVVVFDGDQAGQKAAARALPLCLAENLPARALSLPAGEDPDSFLLKNGAGAFAAALKAARPLTQVVLGRIVRAGDLSSPEGKSQVVAEAGAVLKAIKDPVAALGYLERLAAALGLPPQVVAARLGMPYFPRRRPVAPRPAAPRAGGRVLLNLDRCLLELALGSPAAACRLAEAGALAELADPACQAVGRAVLSLVERRVVPTPAAVCQELGDSPHAPLAASLAADAPPLAPEEAEAQAASVLAQIAAKKIKAERRSSRAARARQDADRTASSLAERQRVSPPPSVETGKES